MSTTLDATVSGAAANSYIASSAAATSLLDPSPYRLAWAAALAADAESGPRLLVRAARVLDGLGFPGEATTTTQAMQWPRCDVDHPSGWVWDGNAIPLPIQIAQAELAGWLSSRAATELDPFGEDGSQNLESVKAGPIAVTFRAEAPTPGRDFLARSIIPMLAARGLVAAGGMVRLVR